MEPEVPSRSEESRSAEGAERGTAELVERIQAGDRAAEAELIERFSHRLLVMLRHLAGDPALADDLHQETLSLVLQKIRGGELREPERLAGFIRSTARYLLIAHRRKHARFRPLDEAAEESGLPGPAARSEPTAVDRVVAEEEARLVRRLLSELRFDRDRRVLFRYYLADDSKEAICEDLGIDPERFNQILHRARQRLLELWTRAEKRQRLFREVRGMMGRIGGNPSPGG